MGILTFKEQDPLTTKIHFKTELGIFEHEIEERITRLQDWITENEKYKKEFDLEMAVNEKGKYFVFKNNECFYYLGFVTKQVIDYYKKSKKNWAVSKITKGEYGNYFIPCDKSNKLYKLHNGAIYYPKNKENKYASLITALKSVFGDFLNVKIFSSNVAFAEVQADSKMFKIEHKKIKFNQQQKIDRILEDL